jgi:hypothetical protein
METIFVDVKGKAVERVRCKDCNNFVDPNFGVRSFQGSNKEEFQCWDCWRKPWEDKDVFTPDDLKFSYGELSVLDEALRACDLHRHSLWEKNLNDKSTMLAQDAKIGILRAKLARIMSAIEKAPEKKGNMEDEVESIPYCY